MEAVIETQPWYVLRLTRLEAAQALVNPRALQERLRDLLKPPETANGGGKASEILTTRKAMHKIVAPSLKVQCPHCDRKFDPRGLPVHMARAHAFPKNGHEEIEEEV